MSQQKVNFVNLYYSVENKVSGKQLLGKESVLFSGNSLCLFVSLRSSSNNTHFIIFISGEN